MNQKNKKLCVIIIIKIEKSPRKTFKLVYPAQKLNTFKTLENKYYANRDLTNL